MDEPIGISPGDWSGRGESNPQRGDGRNLEWWVITSFRETATRLDGKGVPRVVEFELSLKRADKPSADEYRGRVK